MQVVFESDAALVELKLSIVFLQDCLVPWLFKGIIVVRIMLQKSVKLRQFSPNDFIDRVSLIQLSEHNYVFKFFKN